jgi:hypothetical protein
MDGRSKSGSDGYYYFVEISPIKKGTSLTCANNGGTYAADNQNEYWVDYCYGWL